MAPKLPLASKYREYDGNAGLTSTGKAGETQLEPFRLAPIDGCDGPAFYAVAQRSDGVVSYTPERSIKSGKTFFVAAASPDRPPANNPGFDKPLGHELELVPPYRSGDPDGAGLADQGPAALQGQSAGERAGVVHPPRRNTQAGDGTSVTSRPPTPRAWRRSSRRRRTKRALNNNFSISGTMTLPLCHSDQGGKGRCARAMRRMSRRSVAAPAPSAVGNRMGLSLVNTGQSIGSSPVRTSAVGGSSPASSPGCTATGGSLGWRASPAWIATRSPEADASWTRPTSSRRAGCGARGAVPSAWRTDARNPDGPRGVAGGLDRRGSRLRHEMDAPLARQTPEGPSSAGDSRHPLRPSLG